MTNCFSEVKKNFGFGCMRLPMQGDEVDYAEFCKMADEFIARGFNYFDTAHGYIGGKSEIAVRECLVKRHRREEYLLADKLTEPYFRSEADVRPFILDQLSILGVEYLDFYLMHAQNARNFAKFQACRAYETAFRMKEEGYLRHVGISFHDSAAVLDRILSEYPQIEFVQIQFNYFDVVNPIVQSMDCYEVCKKHGKPVVVMEPVKGGTLVNLPPKAREIYARLGTMSEASYAIRYAAGFEGIFMVLSGMSNMAQMLDNLSFMQDFQPLSAKEVQAVEAVRQVLLSVEQIPCTGCRYCTDGCPQKIAIPDLFTLMNQKTLYKTWTTNAEYAQKTKDGGKASACVGCGKCERACPQMLPIRKLLKGVAQEFEK